jgi:peptidoglycan hydrolase FlgJ
MSINAAGLVSSSNSNVVDLMRGNDVEPAAVRRGGRDTPELKKAFTDFAGQTFFGEMMKQMRATSHKPAFFHGGMGEDIFQSQLDQIMVERISETSAKSFSDPMYDLLMAPRS